MRCESRTQCIYLYFILSNRFTLAASVELDSIAELCPSGLTGADFYALCSDAMLVAVKRKIAQLQAGTVIYSTMA